MCPNIKKIVFNKVGGKRALIEIVPLFGTIVKMLTFRTWPLMQKT